MKRICFVLITVLIAGAQVFAQQPTIVRAPPMVTMNPLTGEEASSIGSEFDKALQAASNVRIINQLALNKGMRDYEFTRQDWINAEKTIALGEVLEIDWIVRPQLQKRQGYRNEGIVFSTVLLDVRTKKILYSTPIVLTNLSEAPGKMQSHINEITQMMTGGGGGLQQTNQGIYKEGDRGPSGGWILHDKGNYSDGWRYIEVSPKAIERSVAGSRYVEKVDGCDRAVGSGKKNTELLIQSPNQDYQLVQAAKTCAEIELNWFEDWFLPSREELLKCISASHPQPYTQDIFSNGNYWSSSASNDQVRSVPPDSRGFRDDWFIRAFRAF